MCDDLNALKTKLQSFFTDGMVIVIGSGLSAGEGIPGMGPLSDILLKKIPFKISSKNLSWNKISIDLLAGKGLEETLLSHPPSDDLANAIDDVVSDFIEEHERKIFEQVIGGNRRLKLECLIPYIVKPDRGLPIITTNYDRLVEMALERRGFLVDTMFVGDNFGKFDPEKSRNLLKVDVSRKPKVAKNRYLDNVILCKPHGSVDWYYDTISTSPVRIPFKIGIPRLMITPGAHKYRSGYEKPFDRHRDEANKHIDAASRFLIIGYGFNDDHLETHLEQKIKTGTPSLILTHSLSENAKKIIQSNSNVIAIVSDNASNGSIIIENSIETAIPQKNIWDIEYFSREVFNHE